ncbi:MAG: DUF1573 domain-containing protein [Candidatus Sumerlaeia bacterium]|nr:DUF1573 domain-containing protein [Candidatus Sumerlaeia bacterium]
MNCRTDFRYALVAMVLLAAALILPGSASAAALEFESTSMDAGRFSQGDSVNVEFPFRNTSDRVINITRVRTSCGCTASSGNQERIAPGESSVIKAAFDTRGRSGRQTTTITVETDDPRQSHYPLRLSLDIIQDVYIPEHLADLGVLAPGEGGSGEFSVISFLDKPLEVNKVTPSNELVEVALKESRSFTEDGREGTELVYTYKIPETMPLGDFYFTITLDTNWRSNPLRHSVRGRVLGDVDFNPKQFFLSIPAGEERSSTVTFTSRTTHGFEILDIKGEAGDLEISFDTNKILPRRQQVTATIKAPNENGTFRGVATITTKMDNSENVLTMEIPVNVVVRQLPNRQPVAGPTRPSGN